MYIDEKSVFLQQLVDTIPNPIFYKDTNGVFKFCNRAFLEFLGLNKKDVIDHTVEDISPKELADIYNKADLQLIKLKGKQYYETQVKHRDGSYHDVNFILSVMMDKCGNVEGLVGSMIDITQRKKSDNKTNRLLKLKESMLEVNHVIMKIKDINELFNLILEKAICCIDNAANGSILVFDENKLLRIAAYKGLDPEKVDEFSLKLEDSFIWSASKGVIDKTIIINDIEKLNFIKSAYILENKNIFKIASSISSPIIINENLYGFINVDSPYNNFFDETDIELLEYLTHQAEMVISKHMLYEETIYLSRYDKLTDVYNRRYFEELFNEAITKSDRDNERFILVEFDLNGLKGVNDTYGHLVGDLLIKTFANKMNSSIESLDIIARLGGDEFVGIFFNIDCEILTRKIQELIKYFEDNPIIHEENEIICSFSYGFAEFPKNGKNYSQLLTVADKNMYVNKKNYYKKN